MVISEATRECIREQMERYPAKRGALLPALHLVQREHGHIPPPLQRQIAELFELHPTEIREVVSFYNMLYDRPQGRHHVYVCTNLPCSLRGARALLRGLETHLGITAGETSADGRITLGHEECLGACAWAPVLRVNGDYCEGVDLGRALQIVDGLE